MGKASRGAFGFGAGLLTWFAIGGCSEMSGPAIAVTLTLESVDDVAIPTQLRRPGGLLATIGGGNLQGTSWGHACGAVLSLVEGPLTAVDVAACRLQAGEARTFTITLTDSRFPAGPHRYRFVP